MRKSVFQVASPVAVITALGPVGYCSNNQPAQKPPVISINNTVNDGSFGTTRTGDGGDGNSLNVGGSNNTLTVTGTCASVKAGTITYRDGDPQVQEPGSGNTITKG